MSELDKKTLPTKPAQADLVGLVQEAFEKKNQERVDMLVTNAIKQLKMSRFKPDQTICISLTYLARTNPKIFHQSTSIKEMLKTLLRRDQGPANIKGKSDTILPVLAANILLATCDGPEVRNIILSKLDQWLTSSPKVSEIVMNILTIICMKCQSDPQTIATLIEMRRHWIAYVTDLKLDESPIPIDLCNNVRLLLDKETEPNQMILYVKFLQQYDLDRLGLGRALARLILRRPMTLSTMFSHTEFGDDLANNLCSLIENILYILKNRKIIEKPQHRVINQNENVVKKEPTIKEEEHAAQVKMEAEPISLIAKKPELVKHAPDEAQPRTFNINDEVLRPHIVDIYIRNPNSEQGSWKIDKDIIESVLSLLILLEEKDDFGPYWHRLASCVFDMPMQDYTLFFKDWSLSQPFDMSIDLRRKLYLSRNEILADLSLWGADGAQLIQLLSLFGSSPKYIDKVLDKLTKDKDVETIQTEIFRIKDGAYFDELLQFYSEIGCSKADAFRDYLAEC